MQWGERVTTEGRIQMAVEERCAILLQSYARRLFAKKRLKELRLRKTEVDNMIFHKASKLATIFRMRIAKRRMNTLRRDNKLAVKIQKRVRVFTAKIRVKRRRLEHISATKIQAVGRGFMRRLNTLRMKEALKLKRVASATVIQRNIRRKIGYNKATHQRAHIRLERGLDVAEPVQAWFLTYGRDPEYGLRRTRRILFRALKAILHRRFSRIVSRFGVIFVDIYDGPGLRYPITPLNIEELDERSRSFVRTYLPHSIPKRIKLTDFSAFTTKSHILYLHIPSSLNSLATVNYYVVILQCFVRKILSRRRVRLLRVLRHFLRRYRARYAKRMECVRRIIRLLKRGRAMAAARGVLQILRRESKSILILQCAIRCWLARKVHWVRRQILDIRLINVSGFLHPYSPDYCLDSRTDTFWMVDSAEIASLTIDLKRKYAVSEIGVISSTFASSPKYLTVYHYTKERSYALVADRIPLLAIKKLRWQKVHLPPTVTRYLRLVFENNHGDPNYISIRCLSVIHSKERKLRPHIQNI